MNIDELIKAVANEDLEYLRKFSKKVERERKNEVHPNRKSVKRAIKKSRRRVRCGWKFKIG